MFYFGDGVFRGLGAEAVEEWRAVSQAPFFRELQEAGRVVATEEVPDAGMLADLGPEYEAVLRHERVPFVSYPYEWTFGMLRDAALLHLDVLAAALAADFVLKDASPYNVSWRGVEPVYVDVGSFERLRPGEPWIAYRQFCMLMLYPLLLHAYKGVPFQPWLRGRLEGIEPAELRALFSLRDLLRPGVFAHVVLHSRLERRRAGRDDVRRELAESGFDKRLIESNVRRLRRLVERLRRPRRETEWSRYGPTTSYDEADAHAKEAFVRELAARRRWRLVWDVGCNDGRHARAAVDGADSVVALDADELVVDRLFESLKAEGERRIVPLVVDVADASPGLGWRGVERRRLEERGAPELTLCLALVHHLAVTRNIPLPQLVDWLRSLGTAVAVEFVTRDDPMAQRLLARKRQGSHGDYEVDTFERHLRARFAVERREPLSSGTRILYFATPA